jgi:formylglycine-generating enzyme required for sulfatase activity/serine/threonine protein kinase
VNPDSEPHQEEEDARAAFSEFLAQLDDGNSQDFESFCRERETISAELRHLYSQWCSVESLAGQLREQIGGSKLGSPSQLDAVTAELLRQLELRRGKTQRFSVRKELARGGMGIILEVYDEDLQRPMAMKTIRGNRKGFKVSSASVAATARRFLAEARVTGQLDHPGVVPVHELGIDEEGQLFFTMRLVQGRDLLQIFEEVHKGREGWTVTRALGVLLKACETVAYAHSKGVIHRDLKPANIMVGHFGEVHVMDWGLAKCRDRQDLHDLRLAPKTQEGTAESEPALEGQPILTLDGTVLGTPAYMPPEQALGKVREIDARADVYMMGSLLYELLAGHAPFLQPSARLSSRQVLEELKKGPPQPLETLQPRAAPELVAVCDKAMARDVEMRYTSMVEMADDVRSYLENRVVRAYETGPLAEFRKWVQRNTGVAAALGGIVIVMLAALASIGVVQSLRKAEVERKNDEIEGFSDGLLVKELQQQADLLWPRRKELSNDYRQWLERASQVLSRQASHEKALRNVRTEQSSAGENEPRLRWRRETLRALLADLDELRGLSEEIQSRLEVADSIDVRTVEDHADLWDEAATDIEIGEAYHGLAMLPQVGLVPLGTDPESGLWEFWHVETGVRPRRDPATDRWVLEAACGMVFVLIPGATASIGSQGTDAGGTNYDPDFEDGDALLHEVTIEPFFLSKYEMTQSQWHRVTGNNPSYWLAETTQNGLQVAGTHPVEQVSWTDCVQVLSRFGLELPTEAEWEHSCRGGTQTPWLCRAKEELPQCANLRDIAYRLNFSTAGLVEDWSDGFSFHAPVGSFRTNEFGLHDMAGNVKEWCHDHYGPYGSSQKSTDLRVFRGGGYIDLAREVKSAYRNWSNPSITSGSLGLRPALRVQK